MARKRSMLAMVAAGAGASAIAGFGLGVGRDAWKSSKSNFGIFLIIAILLAALVLPFYGARNMIRGYDRGILKTIFITVVWNLSLVIVGIFAGLVIVIALTSEAEQADQNAMIAFLLPSLASVIVGFLFGLLQRPGRTRAFAVARHNDRFLENEGITETGGKDVSHKDSEGNPLRFLEKSDHRIVFMAVGRRGKRAYIDVSNDGKMVAYSGIV